MNITKILSLGLLILVSLVLSTGIGELSMYSVKPESVTQVVWAALVITGVAGYAVGKIGNKQ